MTLKNIFIIILFFILYYPTYSQQENTFISKSCKLGCGAEFGYNSRIIIRNDTINILRQDLEHQTVVSQYVITDKKEKWKKMNLYGTSKYKAIQVSDSSKKDVQLVLRHGKGTLSIFNKGDCEITLNI
jgi:hypothetical protein